MSNLCVGLAMMLHHPEVLHGTGQVAQSQIAHSVAQRSPFAETRNAESA